MYVERIPDIGETLLAKGYEEHPGGKGANQAVSAALWGQPVPECLVDLQLLTLHDWPMGLQESPIAPLFPD